MGCYYHPEVEAVGMCTKCARGVCSDCARPAEGGLICVGCQETIDKELATESRVAAAQLLQVMRRRVILSWIVLALSCIPAILIWSEARNTDSPFLSTFFS